MLKSKKEREERKKKKKEHQSIGLNLFVFDESDIGRERESL